jgi:lysozyme
MPPRRKKKPNNGVRTALVIAVSAIGIVAAYIGFLWIESRKVKMVRYSAFGIPMPVSYSIHGIDVSRYQQRISWEAVKEMEVNDIRIQFAFIKATEGARSVDPFFKRNWRKSREAGIVRGAYHFFSPTKSGRLQAQNFIDQVDLQPGDLPPVLDVEQAGRVKAATIRKEVKAWLVIVEEYYGVKPIIYANISFYKRYLEGYVDDYPLWVAHYLQPDQPRIERDWDFWQHSETGRVNGIVPKVDFNVFNGDSVAFKALLVRGRAGG